MSPSIYILFGEEGEMRRNEAKRLILATFQHRALQQPYYSEADFGSFCHTLLLPINQFQNETMGRELKKEIATQVRYYY